jgi:hypothetical protein
MTPLELPVLFYSDTTSSLEDLGIKYSDDQHDVKICTFYSIGYILPRDGGRSAIWSGGDQFICDYSYDKVKQLVNKAKQ